MGREGRWLGQEKNDKERKFNLRKGAFKCEIATLLFCQRGKEQSFCYF